MSSETPLVVGLQGTPTPGTDIVTRPPLIHEAASFPLASSTSPAAFKAAKLWHRSSGPLFKAYALALRSKIMGGAGDLSGENQAFFTSTSLPRGVPMKMHDAYTNSRIFSLANVMQNGRNPVLMEDGDSFVGYLESYLDHVEDSSRTDEEKLRNAEEKYRAIKREASLQFELAEFKWKEALQRDSSMTLDKWIDKYGYDYRDACEEREIAKKNLRRAQQCGSQDVLRQKELMESAKSSHIEVPGSNMPCAMHDVSLATTVSLGDPPKDIMYCPLHVLPGFNFTTDDWAKKGLKDQQDLTEMRIDLIKGFTDTWKEIGFPQLDGADKSSRKITKDLDRIRNTIRDWKMVLRYTDIHAFDVNRGLWNITGFRTILPELARTAPPHLKDPVFQTTRILLAYNATLVLQLPRELFTKLFPRNNKANGNLANGDNEGWGKPNTSALEGLEDELLSDLFQTFPFAKMPRQEWDGENELYIRGQFNNLYPSVVGVLARKV